jgi:hypothetical protein
LTDCVGSKKKIKDMCARYITVEQAKTLFIKVSEENSLENWNEKIIGMAMQATVKLGEATGLDNPLKLNPIPIAMQQTNLKDGYIFEIEKE